MLAGMGIDRGRCGLIAYGIIGFVLLPMLAAIAATEAYTWSDFAKVKVEAVSFVLAFLLLAALAFKASWNVMARGFLKWPPISYAVACGALLVMAMVLGFILTLIFGARELMARALW